MFHISKDRQEAHSYYHIITRVDLLNVNFQSKSRLFDSLEFFFVVLISISHAFEHRTIRSSTKKANLAGRTCNTIVGKDTL